MKLAPYSKGLIIVLLLLIISGGLILINRIFLGDAFNREEALHAIYSLWVTRDLKALDFGALWYDTQRQMVWPFLHSWLQGILFLFLGVSYVSARLLSWFFFFGIIILIYLFSNQLCTNKGPKVGVIAVILALTSPIMIQFACENMIEGLGAFLFLLTAYIYTIAEERKITVEFLYLALLIGLSIFTNYLYAYLIIPAFLVMTLINLGPLTIEAIKLRREGEKKAVHFVWWSYRKIIVLISLLVLGGTWFSVSAQRKILLLINSIFLYSPGAEIQGVWPNLLFYPKAIVENISFSPWLGVLLLAALVLPQVARYYGGLKHLYVYCWTVILLLTLTISPKSVQMMFIILPFLFIILAGGLVYLLDQLHNLDRKLAIGLLAVVFLPTLISLPKLYSAYCPPNPGQNMITVLKYFQSVIPSGDKLVTLVNLKHFNPEGVKFYFRDWPGGVMTENKPEELGQNDYYITVELDQNSVYFKEVIDDSLYSWNDWLRENELTGKIKPFAQGRFDQIGLTAKVYSTR